MVMQPHPSYYIMYEINWAIRLAIIMSSEWWRQSHTQVALVTSAWFTLYYVNLYSFSVFVKPELKRVNVDKKRT